MPRPSVFENFPALLRCDYGPYMGILDAWHDADTPKVILDPGFDETPTRWIRLLGVMAPELSTEAGKSMLSWVMAQFPPPLPVRCVTQKTPKSGAQQMTFDRYVGTLYTVRGSEVVSINDAINSELVARGLLA